MKSRRRTADIEELARMAARLAGRDPDEHLKMEMAGVVRFDDVLWRYPDFLTRAEAAYQVLWRPNLTLPRSLDIGQHSAATGSRRY